MRDMSFERLCELERDYFVPELREYPAIVDPGSFTAPNHHLPTPAHRAITMSMRLLAWNPEEKLSERLIGTAVDDSEATKLFAGIINGSQIRFTTDEVVRFTRNGSVVPVKSTCPEADELFASTIKYVPDAGRTIKKYRTALYVDEHLNTTFIKKFVGEDTAMSLQEFFVDGVLYPAGTIVALRDEQAHSDRVDESAENNHWRVRLFDIESITDVRPLRLSMFAHREKDDRLLFSQNVDGGYDMYRLKLADMTIDHLRAITASYIERSLNGSTRL